MRKVILEDWRRIEAATGVRVTGRGTISGRTMAADTVTIDHWIDGDTLVTTDQDKVRLIGMDTPEMSDRCSQAGAAKAFVEDLAPAGSKVKLVAPETENNKDRYGRLLRYVQVKKIDVGFELQLANLAKARYDSLDGFPWHPRERSYRMLGANPDRKAVCQWEKVAPLLLAGVGDDHDDEKSRRHLRHLLTHRAKTVRHLSETVHEKRKRQAAKTQAARVQQRQQREENDNESDQRRYDSNPYNDGGPGTPLPGGGQSCPPGGCW